MKSVPNAKQHLNERIFTSWNHTSIISDLDATFTSTLYYM